MSRLLSQRRVGVATEGREYVGVFAALPPHAQIAQRRGRKLARTNDWSNLGRTFPTLWLAIIGQNWSLDWVQKNGRNGHRRRIFRRPSVAMCWQYVHFSTSRLPGRLLCADGLVAQLVHRARPIEGGVASQCVSCHARPVPLAHALASHRLVRVGRSTRCLYMCKVQVKDDVLLRSKCPECTVMLRICVMWSSWCKISLDCRRVVCDTMTGQTLVQHRPASIRLCNQCTVA